jgi:hypothetical protein
LSASTPIPQWEALLLLQHHIDHIGFATVPATPEKRPHAFFYPYDHFLSVFRNEAGLEKRSRGRHHFKRVDADYFASQSRNVELKAFFHHFLDCDNLLLVRLDTPVASSVYSECRIKSRLFQIITHNHLSILLIYLPV